MAVDMHLKIEGEIEGESKDKDHEGEIDVLAWSWGMSQSGTFHYGGGGGSGKANFQDISVTKWLDTASAPLMQHCSTGEHFTKATLTVRKAGGKPLEYLTIVMKKVLVTSVSTGGSGGEDQLTENVTLNFAEVKVTYKSQNDKGAVDKTKDYIWNIEANTGEA